MSRTALVTGASSGIGAAICESLLARGDRVIGIARDFGKFPSVDHDRFTAFPLDLAGIDALANQLQDLTAAHAAVDTLICNAGRGRFGHLEQFSYVQIRELIELNFTAHAYLVRAYLPLMKRAERGDVVFMGSEAALKGSRQGAVYCASKFAIRGFAQALREECSSAGIRITTINPGMVRTPFFDELDFAPGEEADNYVLPEDVARLVCAVLDTRRGAVVDEIDISPQKRVVRFGERESDVGD